jgi:hypothetical protein
MIYAVVNEILMDDILDEFEKRRKNRLSLLNATAATAAR